MLHHAVILGCDKGIIQLILDYNAERDRTRSHSDLAVEENRALIEKNKHKFFRKDSLSRADKLARSGEKAQPESPTTVPVLLSPERNHKGSKSPEPISQAKRTFRELEKRGSAGDKNKSIVSNFRKGSTDEYLFVRKPAIHMR